MRHDIAKSAMSKEERELRSRAGQILSGAGLIHGNLSTRLQKCGNPNCRCNRGEKHELFVLVVRQAGTTVQVPVPRRLVPTVRRWVEQEKDLQNILRRISELQTERVRELKKRATPGE
jgi:hypothetical protein